MDISQQCAAAETAQHYGIGGGPGGAEGTFIGWPNQGIEYWNGYWRRRADEGFFDDIEAAELRCEDLARGFCPASIDGYCVGGTQDGKCHG